MQTEQNSNRNTGRWDWKMSYPKTRDDVRAAEDDQIIKWWRFLPPANTKEKHILLSDITYEFKKRFKTPKN